MIRPRPGNFNYSNEEYQQMLRSIDMVKYYGASGAVFGVLNQDNTIDIERMKELIERVRPLKVVCHKAFDETPDAYQALD